MVGDIKNRTFTIDNNTYGGNSISGQVSPRI